MDSLFEKAGVAIPSEVNGIANVLDYAKLNWTIEQKPISTEYGLIPNRVANYRSDTKECLGIVSNDEYKVIQNTEAFDFVDNLSDFTIEKAGAFFGGSKVFIVGKSNDQFELDNGDMINMYFTFIHGHDGKTSIKMIISPIRMFCMNQMNLMLRTASFRHAIKHTGNVTTKLDTVHKAFESAHEYTGELKTSLVNLINTKIDSPMFDMFINEVFKAKEGATSAECDRMQAARDRVFYLYTQKDDLANYRGTAFGALSAVSDYVSHMLPKRVASGDYTTNNLFINSIDGNKVIDTAYKVIRSIAA